MASEVSICNMALAHISAGQISSLNEQRTQAQKCKLFYASSRDLVLRDHKWTFAQRRRALTPIDVPTEYSGKYFYGYVQPSDCLKTHFVYESTVLSIDPVSTKPQPFKKARAATGELVIMTNVSTAELEYTMRVTDPTWFDEEFITALALRLASILAVPLVKNQKLKDLLHREYIFYLRQGEASDENSQDTQEEKEQENPWIAARTGGF